MELDYFKETGEHLDVKNITLCSGSRDSDGDVPDVDWDPDDGKVRVHWYDAGGSDGSLGAREIVS